MVEIVKTDIKCVDQRLHPFIKELSKFKKSVEQDILYLTLLRKNAQIFGRSGDKALEAIYTLYVLREFVLQTHLYLRYSDLPHLYRFTLATQGDFHNFRTLDPHLGYFQDYLRQNGHRYETLFSVAAKTVLKFNDKDMIETFLNNMEGHITQVLPRRRLKETWTYKEQLPFHIMEEALDDLTTELFRRKTIKFVPK